MQPKVIRFLQERGMTLVIFVALFSFLILPFGQQRAFCQYQSNRQDSATNIDDLFVQVGNKVPAFGGMFVDEGKDTLYVYLVPGQAGDPASVDEAITDVFREERPPEHRLETLVGQYTFLQLKDWHERMSPGVLSIPGAVLTGIDHFKNRLRAGVEKLDLAPKVEAVLATLNIPLGAVDIQQMPPIENAQQTLRSFWRDNNGPMGGLQIQRDISRVDDGGVCTLGFNAVRGPAVGFVTNSHCTNAQGAGAGTVFSQPNTIFAVATRIGTVPADGDPCYWPTPTCPAPGGAMCPQPPPPQLARVCRYSDSAFARYTGPFTLYTAVAHPPGLGSLAWNGNTRFYVVSTGVAGGCRIPGCPVQKVGRTTGWTQGHIQMVNVDQDVAGSNITLLQQAYVNMDATNSLLGGDSGSPVFGHIAPVGNAMGSDVVGLVGIAWGSNHCLNALGQDVCPRVNCANAQNDPPGTPCQMFYSPIENVKAELGLTQVCEPGYGC